MEAHVYPQMYRVEKEHWWFVARREILARYLDARAPLPDGARILDVGCGTGAILEMFSARHDAWGVDTSPQAIAFCRERGLSKLRLGPLAEFSAPAPFDLITMLDVVEHAEDDLGLLRDALPLLGDRGRLLVTVPAFPSLWSAHDEMLHHERRYTRDLLRRRIAEAGFVTEHITFFNTFLFPVALARRTLGRLAGMEQTHDLDIPAPALNALLRRVFAAEGDVLRSGSLPFGLSLLCLASKAPR